MSILAALKVASKNSGRELSKQFNNNKPALALIASVFLFGSFFYSLAQVTVFKNSLSPLARMTELNIFHSRYARAQENPVSLETAVSQEICQSVPVNVTVADPDFEIYKQQKLCDNEIFNQTYAILEMDPEEEALHDKIESILQNTPMNEMIDSISQQDQTVAAFLVGIALKESGLGFHSPSKNGTTCYNYWGFKGATNPTSGGYSCFSSPEEAVQIVGDKIQKYVDKNIKTPSQMVVWKCGSSCQGHSPESVRDWISDVSRYFYQVNEI